MQHVPSLESKGKELVDTLKILEKKQRQKNKTSRSTSSTSVFARVVGVIEFQCPHCGTISTCHVDGLMMRLRCGSSRCRRKFLLGLRLFAALSGAHFRPHPDHVAPPLRDWNPEPPTRDSGSPDRKRRSPWLPAEAAGPPAHRNEPRNDFVELPVDEDDDDEFERAASEATSEIVAAAGEK